MQEHGFAGWIWTACVFVGLQDGLCLFACVLGCLSVCVCVCACVCSSKSDKGCSWVYAGVFPGHISGTQN